MSARQTAPALAAELSKLIRLCRHRARESNSQEEEEVSPEADLKTRLENLNRVESTVLPAISGLVTELLEVLDLPAKDSVSPQPKLGEALEIVPRFTSLVEDLARSVLPPDYSNPEICRLIDQNYRQLHQFKSHYLKKTVTEFMKDDFPSLFVEISSFVSHGQYYDYKFKPLDRSNAPQHAGAAGRVQIMISRILNIIRGSNFDIIQSIWTHCQFMLGHYMSYIQVCINFTNSLDPARTEPDYAPHIPAVLELLDQTMVLLKMCRLFSRKIGSTRLFKFAEGMSSAELESFTAVSEKFENHVFGLIGYMHSVADGEEKLSWDLKPDVERIIHDVNFSLDFIRSHMVPSYPPQTVDEVMDQLFGTFSENFFPYFDRHVARLTQFQAVG
ncbi:hypothetical protein PGT21_005939 [Puccinia graminis f. sp. tritici]|uniref:Uncharacterized protein n=1 Tax=Puccinia graminis f. sp. tritici TaxID=56615 RepID=A0A5B0NGQ6_PUCGR|nr:hypothetical protein PGTUg99_025695 [Puccinia graminis f. sp. tritici]KAA1105396.1 hypothetical protein PGT21_005939 [Puccinia graminis f. sp. tritici]